MSGLTFGFRRRLALLRLSRLAFGFSRRLALGLFGGGLSSLTFGFRRCLALGLFGGFAARFFSRLALLRLSRLAFGFSRRLALGLFGGGLSSLTFGFRRCLALGLFGGFAARFFSRLALLRLSRLALGLLGGFAARFLSSLAFFRLSRLTFGFFHRFTTRFLSGLTFGLLGGFAARFFFALATDFRLASRLCFAFGPRQPGLPFRFLTLAAAIFLRLSLQLRPNGGFVHHLRLDRINFILFGTWRAREIQIKQQKRAHHGMHRDGNHRGYDILIARPVFQVH